VLALSAVSNVGERHDPCVERRIREARPTSLRAFDAELVGQALEVLFDGVLRHDEGRRDLTHGRRLGEHVTGREWRAQRDEHVALARRDRRPLRDGLGRTANRRDLTAELQASSPEQELIRSLQRLHAGEATTVNCRAVARTTVLDEPATVEPVEHRVDARNGRVVHDDVVVGRAAERQPVALE
jgi:hypothetical protein